MKLEKSITVDNMNSNLLNIRYAVRGPVVQRAAQIERELEKGVQKPFQRVVRANIGDCHALGQRPITFLRQVLALVACPELVADVGGAGSALPADVLERARELLGDCTMGSVGAYSASSGLRVVREDVARYLRRRDGGVPADAEDVWLGAGASDLVKSVLTLLLHTAPGGKPPSVMIPIPQYPLFSGTLAELGLHQANYYLEEEREWALDVAELERSWREASEDHCVRAIVVINPGNPTGQVLTRENMEEIVKFAHRHNLFLMADEVYQENIVCKPFHSFKKMMHEMGAPYSGMELASFATCSKGWAAECGVRAGFVELTRLAEGVREAFVTARGVMQCPGVLGQCLLDCVVRPPAVGDQSYDQFARERRRVHAVLCERAAAAHEAFNSIPGYSCNTIDGAMFAFPRVTLPPAACEAAHALSMLPDEFYCLQLLEHTGVCVVPGSGFGQRPGTYHFRTTILHPSDEFRHMMDAITAFHTHFLRQYSASTPTSTASSTSSI